MTRRARGEGSIYRQRPGLWAASVFTSEPGEPPKRKTIYGKTQEEVREKLAALVRRRDTGMLPETGNITTEQYLRHWLEYVARPRLRRSTFSRYRRAVEDDLIPVLGTIRLDKLRPSDVRVVIARRVNRGHAAATANYPRAVLRSALSDAVAEDLLARNVAAVTDPATGQSREAEPFTQNEARRFLDAIAGHRLRALWLITLSLGLRRGEVLGLRWEDVDEAAGVLRVRQSIQYVERQVVVESLKTKKARRDLVLPAQLVDALHEHRQQQLEEQLRTGRRWRDTGLVFVDQVGDMLKPYLVSSEFKRILRRSGMRERRLYDLRHSAATLMLAQGVDLRVIMQILGHSTITLTADTYTRVVNPLMRDAADAIGRSLWGDEAVQHKYSIKTGNKLYKRGRIETI